jgi:peptide/nickel transport system substrate-binding protein/oligopeptide transport system substrate-binding protein
MEAGSAVPREEVEKGGKEFAGHPVGCGPFRFKEWVRGSEITLEKFDRFYGEPVRFAGIQYKILPNVEVAFQQYKAGDLDILDEIPQGRLAALVKDLPREFNQWPILSIYYFGFNMDKEPFRNNVKLRQALSYAIDREKICSIIFEGNSVPAKGILPPGIDGYDSTINGYPYDVKKAKELLKEAGYSEGKGLPPVTLLYNQNERHNRVAQYVQALLEKIGVKITLKELEWGTYLQALQKGEPAFFRLGWVADLPDPDNFMFPLLHSSQIGKGDNFSHFRNISYDSLVTAARTERDNSRRIALYRQADRLAMENAVWIMIAYNMDVCLIKEKWKGIVLSRQGDFAVPLETMYKIN